MRNFIPLLISLLGIPLSAKELPLYAARGFEDSSCYSHVGTLYCPASETCRLEIFEGPKTLSFSSSARDPEKILSGPYTARFTFRIHVEKNIYGIEILSSQSLTKDEFLRRVTESGLANKVSCP